MPGQALAYKIGERNIRGVRAEAEQRLGAEFNLREFHRTVLSCPGPLPVLQSCVDTWAGGRGSGDTGEAGGVAGGVARTGRNSLVLVILAALALVRLVQI